MKLEIALHYFCESELLILNTSCIYYYFKHCDSFSLLVLKEREHSFRRICTNNCWKVAENDVTVQPTNVEMIQYNYYIFLIVLKYYT